jgi:RNase P/RNase MRP subunit POP5
VKGGKVVNDLKESGTVKTAKQKTLCENLSTKAKEKNALVESRQL